MSIDSLNTHDIFRFKEKVSEKQQLKFQLAGETLSILSNKHLKIWFYLYGTNALQIQLLWNLHAVFSDHSAKEL